MALAFHLQIDKDLVRWILARHYRPGQHRVEASWDQFISGMCPVSALCAPRLIGGLGQAHPYAHDAGVFVRCRIKEQSVVHKTGNGCNCSVLLGSSRPNKGDRPEARAEE